jgi:hypothetical protein
MASSPPAAKKHSQLYPISAKGTSATASAPPAAPKKRSRIIVEGTRRAKAAAPAKKRNIESKAEAPPLAKKRKIESEAEALPLRSRRPPQPWMPAEEQLLEELKAAGQSWNDIVRAFPTRSMESAKGHWEARARVSRIISTLRSIVLRILGHTLRFTMESGAEKILDTGRRTALKTNEGCW